MAHSIHGAFKPNRNDNLCTPRILVECLRPYVQAWQKRTPTQMDGTGGYIQADLTGQTVWCPFDLESSEFVHFFKELGCKVVASHIDNGQDFFEYIPDHFDLICSNPPFSLKEAVFQRCNTLGRPWVMLSNAMCINYMRLASYFADHPVQMLIPDKRVSFDGNPSSFTSAYFCSDFLDTELEFVHLPHCNSGKDFIPSRMCQK